MSDRGVPFSDLPGRLCLAQCPDKAYPSNTSTVQVRCDRSLGHAGPHYDATHDQEWGAS